jgi:hypothetical protein
LNLTDAGREYSPRVPPVRVIEVRMARCSVGCLNDRCTDVVCTGTRILKLEEQVKLLAERAQNSSVRIAELRKALDDAREDFTIAMNGFRRQLAPMVVPLKKS